MSVKLRFAPSPTGKPHVGLIRTALINYIYAEQHGGEFLLRFEDTDKNRNTDNSKEIIMQALSWCKLTFSNWKRPTLQSERKAMYDRQIKRLMLSSDTSHFLYRCTCTEKHTEENCSKGRDLLDAKGAVRFDVKRYIERYGDSLCIDDMVMGETIFDLNNINDFVLMRSDNSYLYVFTSVFDDLMMGITHIIRGVDLLNSTPSQILLIRLFNILDGMERSFRYGHIPLIKSQRGGKLSKRDEESNFLSYISEGYLSEAIVNYLLLLGWGSRDNREIFTIQEFFKIFKLESLRKSNIFFDKLKLKAMNGAYIRRMKADDFTRRYLEYVELYGKTKFRKVILTDVVRGKIYNLADQLKERIKIFAEAEDYLLPILTKSDEYRAKDIPVNGNDVSRERIERYLENVLEDFTSLKHRDAILEMNREERKFLRYAITGANITLPLDTLIPIMGQSDVKNRVKASLQHLGKWV